ncbi:hypothetical protein AR454_28665 [Bacillus mycoides]|uniref:hypothetical protein n=1 Tax=Bacillus mycoides TaxID=1405 RepID=UPI001E3358A4|nr:hypothetical protein [Bacillus mycoides]MCD4646337.1 hypothetical protein [Bacillus mycoides]
MMNKIIELVKGNTKVKTQEQAAKEIAKLDTQLSELESQLTQAQQEHAKVSRALEIVEASLIIDEGDKQALASQKKAHSKLDELAKRIAELEPKIAEVSQKKQLAVQESYRAQGELARKHNQKIERDRHLTGRFNRALGIEENVFQLHAVSPDGIDLGGAYGLGETSQLNPQGEDWKFIVDMNNEDYAKGQAEAEVIAKELTDSIKAVFEKHGVELDEQTLINLSRI